MYLSLLYAPTNHCRKSAVPEYYHSKHAQSGSHRQIFHVDASPHKKISTASWKISSPIGGLIRHHDKTDDTARNYSQHAITTRSVAWQDHHDKADNPELAILRWISEEINETEKYDKADQRVCTPTSWQLRPNFGEREGQQKERDHASWIISHRTVACKPREEIYKSPLHSSGM